MFAIPTPAIAASDPRCPAKETFTTCTKLLEIIAMIAGRPIFVIYLIASSKANSFVIIVKSSVIAPTWAFGMLSKWLSGVERAYSDNSNF